MSTEADGAAQNVKVKVNRIRIRQKGIPCWIVGSRMEVFKGTGDEKL